jgi:hypothetical protein
MMLEHTRGMRVLKVGCMSAFNEVGNKQELTRKTDECEKSLTLF